MIQVETIPYSKNPALWDQLLENDPVQYPLGLPADQAYSIAYASSISYDDISLIACEGTQPLAGLQMTLFSTPDGTRAINFYGRTALLRLNGSVDRLILEKAQKRLIEGLIELCKTLGNPKLNLLEVCLGGNLSDFSTLLLSLGAAATPQYKQVIDLTQPEAELRRDLRKSYKSLITWGEKNLALTLYNFHNIKPDIMEQFHQLHIDVAGRETRPKESWDLQCQQVANGEAFIIMGELDGKLVTAGLFLNSPKFCYYGVSASNRDMFDKPLSHAVIWQAIMEAKRLGCRLMELGDLTHFYPDHYSEKEKNIAIFKRGFGGQARIFLNIEFAPGMTAP